MAPGADLLESPLEDLLTVIHDALERAARPTKRGARHAGASPVRRRPAPRPVCRRSVYLHRTSERDAALVAPWADFLFEQGLEVIHPVFEGDEAEVREYHEENLRTADGIVIFFGAANERLAAPQVHASCRRLRDTAARSRRRSSPSASCRRRPRRRNVSARTRPLVVRQWDGLSPDPWQPIIAAPEGMTVFNPFPGLRPFEPDEDHLFFGREKEIDELLRRLRSTRFLSVVGTSGSGKSSLVRSGLIPSLYSGFMVAAGSSWRVADPPSRRRSDWTSGRGARPAPACWAPHDSELAGDQPRAGGGDAAPRHARARRRRPSRENPGPATTSSSSSISSRSCSASVEAAWSTTRATKRSRSSSSSSRRPARPRCRSTSC